MNDMEVIALMSCYICEHGALIDFCLRSCELIMCARASLGAQQMLRCTHHKTSSVTIFQASSSFVAKSSVTVLPAAESLADRNTLVQKCLPHKLARRRDE